MCKDGEAVQMIATITSESLSYWEHVDTDEEPQDAPLFGTIIPQSYSGILQHIIGSRAEQAQRCERIGTA